MCSPKSISLLKIKCPHINKLKLPSCAKNYTLRGLNSQITASYSIGMNILGLSAFYHDSAAALLVDGQIVSACQEERFTRIKHDKSFPMHSIEYCLQSSGLSLQDIDYICFYEKPFLKFERLLETLITYAPFKGFKTYIKAMPSWLESKLNLKSYLKKQFLKIDPQGLADKTQLQFSYHHFSHASSCYFPSPYSSAAILCVDGVGEWETVSVWHGKGQKINPLFKVNFPHSLGLLYSAFTYYCGFKVNSGEYKLMGLAPYGQPKYVDVIFDHLVDVKADGSFKLDMKYFPYPHSMRMINSEFEDLFGQKSRVPESDLTDFYKDVAASIQVVLEQILVKMVNHIYSITGEQNLCLAGGVALNCVANSVLKEQTPFKNIWVQPAAGDAGGALGAAMAVWHHTLGHEKRISDQMQQCYLGPEYSSQQIKSSLEAIDAQFEQLEDVQLYQAASRSLAQGKVIGWFDGRMEYGPRALGARSILADARCQQMQKNLNLKIKFRESFRPFAPITLNEDNNFNFTESPYMLFTAKVNTSELPAITHVDNSARLQTVNSDNGRIYKLLKQFKQLTGCDTLINTSFNVRGEPIVCSPEDAYSCFLNTHMDELIIGNYYLKKENQTHKRQLPQRDFVLD